MNILSESFPSNFRFTSGLKQDNITELWNANLTNLIRSMSADVEDPFLGHLKLPTLRRLQWLPLSWIAAVLVGVAKSRLGGLLLLPFPLRTCKWLLS